MGTSPLYLLAMRASRLPKHPVSDGSAAMLWGYFTSAARGAARYEDPEFRRFLRRYQHLCLLVGKHEATRKVVAAARRSWKARHPGLATGAAHAERAPAVELMGLRFDPETMDSAVSGAWPGARLRGRRTRSSPPMPAICA